MTKYDSVMKDISNKNLVVDEDCSCYCSYLREALPQVHPLIFNRNSCIAGCIKHKISKFERKLIEKHKRKVKKQTNGRI